MKTPIIPLLIASILVLCQATQLLDAEQSPATPPAGTPDGGAAAETKSGATPEAPATPPFENAGQKAEHLIIPALEFRDVTVHQAVDLLIKRSRELSPDGKGVDLVLKSSPAAEAARITVSLKNIPLIEAAKYVAGLTNLSLKVQPRALVLQPPSTDVPSLGDIPKPVVTREWKVPPGMISPKPGGRITDSDSATAWLIAHGVKFGEGTAALYVIKSSNLIVRNTEDELDLVDTLVKAAVTARPAAKMEEALPRSSVPTTSAPAENPLLDKAARLIIPKIDLADASVAESVELLRRKAMEADPEKRGINIVLGNMAAAPATDTAGKVWPKPSVSSSKITLSLRNIPLIEALRYLTGLSGLELVVQPDALVIQAHPPAGNNAPNPPATPRPHAAAGQNIHGAVPDNALALLRWLQPGMTRLEVETRFAEDGGLVFPLAERYYPRGFTVDSYVVMVELRFQPADMPDAVFNDAPQRDEWLRKHSDRDWFNPHDTLRSVGTAYLSHPAID